MNYRFSHGGDFSAVVAVVSFCAFWLLFRVVSVAGIWPFVVTMVLFLLAAGWSAFDYFWFQSRHERALRAFAARIDGWDYAPGTSAYAQRLHAFPFGVGSNPRDVDVVRGPLNGFACASFTHQYDEANSVDEVGIPLSWQIDIVTLVYPLAKIDIVPDDVLAKFAKLLGGQDIDFESAAFNAEWRVKAGDRKYAHDIVHPRLMERLLWSDAKGLAIRIEGPYVYAWSAGRRGPEDLARRIGVLTAVARQIPDFVYREFKEVHDRIAEAARKREEAAPAWAKTPFALSGGRYTDLGRERYKEMGLRDLAGDNWQPPQDDDSGSGSWRWDAPPEDPHAKGSP